jgi:hypothetical protein
MNVRSGTNASLIGRQVCSRDSGHLWEVMRKTGIKEVSKGDFILHHYCFDFWGRWWYWGLIQGFALEGSLSTA